MAIKGIFYVFAPVSDFTRSKNLPYASQVDF